MTSILDHIKDDKQKVGTVAALTNAANLYGVSRTAEALHVHPAHISNLSSRGLSPTLREALEKMGVIRSVRRQYRRAAFFGYDEKGRQLAEAFDRYCRDRQITMTDIAVAAAYAQLEKEQANGH